MKINEVLTEGPILQKAVRGFNRDAKKVAGAYNTASNAIKNGFKGAVQGYKDSVAQRQASAAASKTTQAANQNINIELGKWHQYAAQRGASANMKDPKVFQSELQKWANARYPSAGNAIDVTAVNPGSASTVNKYITDMYNTAMANRSLKTQQPQQTQQTQSTTTPAASQPGYGQTQAGILVPNQVGTGPRPTQQAPDDQANVSQQAQAAGIKIINQDPIVIDYKNSHFGLNDQGQWMHMKSGKVPPQAMQAFLSQQHDISLGTA